MIYSYPEFRFRPAIGAWGRSRRSGGLMGQQLPKNSISASKLESLESRVLLAATMVRDLNLTGWTGPLDARIFPNPPIEVGGNLFFAFNDGTSGLELWRSDGT